MGDISMETIGSNQNLTRAKASGQAYAFCSDYFSCPTTTLRIQHGKKEEANNEERADDTSAASVSHPDHRMPFICIGPICIPWSAIWPLLLIVLRPFWNCLKPRLKKIDWLRKYIDEEEEDNSPVELVSVSEKEATDLRSGVKHINSEQEWDSLMSKAASLDLPVLVKFTASWCKPCKAIAPLFQSLAEANGELIFGEIDYDANKKLAKRLGAKIMPTFQLYRHFTKTSEFIGAKEEKLKDAASLCTAEKNKLELVKREGGTAKEDEKGLLMLQFNKDSRAFSVVSKAENEPTVLFVESEPLGRTVAVKENSSGFEFKKPSGCRRLTPYAYYNKSRLFLKGQSFDCAAATTD